MENKRLTYQIWGTFSDTPYRLIAEAERGNDIAILYERARREGMRQGEIYKKINGSYRAISIYDVQY